MKVNELIYYLQNISNNGYGQLDVYYRHGASGDCGPVGCPYLNEECDPETGPFDTTSPYVSLYVGN